MIANLNRPAQFELTPLTSSVGDSDLTWCTQLSNASVAVNLSDMFSSL
jgi:hypothetical protein